MTTLTMPDGVFPVMLTPFLDDGAVDWKGVDALTDWYIQAGVTGLFTVALSSEMYELDDAERLQLARRVVKRTHGRVPVVAAGTFGGEIAQQADFVRQMADTGVRAVVVITCQLAAQDEPDDIWQANAEQLLNLTGEIPLGLYECPVPYKRLLSPVVIGWAADTGRFFFHKDTSCDANAIAAKIAAVAGTPFRFYNADGPTLSASLQAGGHGYSGIGANYFPELFVWLCQNHATEPEQAAQVQAFLDAHNKLIHHKYPTSAKVYTGMNPVCRTHQVTLDEDDQAALQAMAETVSTLLR